MGSFAVIRLGDYELGRIRNEVDDELLAVFNDAMLVLQTMKASTYYDWWNSEHDEDDGEDYDVDVVQLRAPGRTIAARLDLLGITEREVLELLRQQFKYTEELHQEDFYIDVPELSERSKQSVAVAASLTVERWMESIRNLDDILDEQRPYEPGSPRWLFELVDSWEWRHLLRLFLLVWPDEDVELDLTDLGEGGWLDTEFESYRPSTAMVTLRQSLAAHAPIVVLTEGRTDSEFLESALALIHPHLQDLIRFLDYSSRPEGGAGALVRSVKAFASAGISNRVVALFDNDAAARDALRALDMAGLPKNITVLRYPATDLLARYPTLGPPSDDEPEGRIASADVNGLAGSIELYLGTDVLTQSNGELYPVQWRSYIAGVRAYQGEVTGKDQIHARFREKLRNATTEETHSPAWLDLRAVLSTIIDAFLDQPLPPHICEHTGRSEASLRLRRVTPS